MDRREFLISIGAAGAVTGLCGAIVPAQTGVQVISGYPDPYWTGWVPGPLYNGYPMSGRLLWQTGHRDLSAKDHVTFWVVNVSIYNKEEFGVDEIIRRRLRNGIAKTQKMIDREFARASSRGFAECPGGPHSCEDEMGNAIHGYRIQKIRGMNYPVKPEGMWGVNPVMLKDDCFTIIDNAPIESLRKTGGRKFLVDSLRRDLRR